MDNIDQQYAKLKQMTIDKENLHSKLKKIEEQATRLKEKKEMLELEVEERAEHHKNL